MIQHKYILWTIFLFTVNNLGWTQTERLNVEVVPAFQDKGAVVLQLTGNFHRTPVKNAEAKDNETVATLIRLIQANKEGTVESIRGLWRPEDRPQIESILSKKTVAEGNANFFRSVTRSEIVAEINYGALLVVLVEHFNPQGSVVNPYVFRRGNDIMLQTNELQSDSVFMPLVSIVKTSLNRTSNSPR